jgi:hypothetical protein
MRVMNPAAMALQQLDHQGPRRATSASARVSKSPKALTRSGAEDPGLAWEGLGEGIGAE